MQASLYRCNLPVRMDTGVRQSAIWISGVRSSGVNSLHPSDPLAHDGVESERHGVSSDDEAVGCDTYHLPRGTGEASKEVVVVLRCSNGEAPCSTPMPIL